MLKEKYVCSEYGRTYYWISKCNSNIYLIFLPGLTANHKLFEQQTEYFEGKYNIVVWNCPAHNSNEDQPEIVNELIESFVGRIRREIIR